MKVFRNSPGNENAIASTFTLIELLVVIAIISILMAMLLPSFATAREMGRKTVDRNNFKQIGIAYLNYTDDNNSWVPPFNVYFYPSFAVPFNLLSQYLGIVGGGPGEANANSIIWQQAGKYPVLHCQSGIGLTNNTSPWPSDSTYMQNLNLCNSNTSSADPIGYGWPSRMMKIYQFRSLSDAIVQEERWTANGQGIDYNVIPYNSHTRGGRGRNILYLDGHAIWAKALEYDCPEGTGIKSPLERAHLPDP